MSYCKFPFEKIVIGRQGDVYNCCSGWLPKAIGNVFKEQDFNKIWNSEAVQAIRTSMINETYDFCIPGYCPYLLNGIYKISKKTTCDDNSRTKAQDIILSKGPATMVINYDPTCNLHCKSCRKRIITLGKEQTGWLLKFQADLVDTPLFRNVHELILAGHGEPFASKVYLTLLKNIDEQRFPHLKITLITNGILFSPANWESISNAHYAINFIKVSIDAATKGTYAKIRCGGDFDLLLKNLEFMSELKKQMKCKLQATFVMQKENYREMPAFVILMKKYSFDQIFFSKIVNFESFSEEEFQDVAIHRKDHPEHSAFLEILRNPVMKESGVTIANENE
jgi:radical SAM protein with 4Fe4S-binding SPASM domain